MYGEGGELALYDPARPRLERKAFSFDRVFDSGAGQEEVYADTQPLIRSVLDGVCCFFVFWGVLPTVEALTRANQPTNALTNTQTNKQTH